MTAERKYQDVDDFGNLENVIKKVNPAFVDMTKRMPGPIANFAQQKLSSTISEKPAFGSELPPMFIFYLSQGVI